VRGVGGKAALHFKRLLDPFQHGVQRIDQVADFIFAAGVGQALVQIGVADLVRLVDDVFDGDKQLAGQARRPSRPPPASATAIAANSDAADCRIWLASSSEPATCTA
jgi:hypothetical protein